MALAGPDGRRGLPRLSYLRVLHGVRARPVGERNRSVPSRDAIVRNVRMADEAALATSLGDSIV
jgi:hypothetical protein